MSNTLSIDNFFLKKTDFEIKKHPKNGCFSNMIYSNLFTQIHFSSRV